MPPKKADKADKAKDNTPTVKTRAMAKKEAAAAAAPIVAITPAAPAKAPAKGGKKAARTPATKPTAKPVPKPTKGVKRKRKADGLLEAGNSDSDSDSDSDKPAKRPKQKRKADDDGDGGSSSSSSSSESVDSIDNPSYRALRGRLDDRLDDIEEAIRAVGRSTYKNIILPDHKSTETRREKRANDNAIRSDEDVEPLTVKKRKSKNFPDGFVVVSFNELGEMAKVLEDLLAASLAKRRIRHPKAKGLDPKETKTPAKRWAKHGLTLRQLLNLYNHTGSAVQQPTDSALKEKCKQYGLNPVGGTLWDLDRATLLYELAAKQRLYDLPQIVMEEIKSALEGVEAPKEAANGKNQDKKERTNKDGELMDQDVVTVTSDGQSQQFTQVNVSGHRLRCMWHAVQEIWLGRQTAPGTTLDERYPVNARVRDLWEAVMYEPDGSTNPARLSRRELYRAMQQDSGSEAYDDTLQDRMDSLEMGDIDLLQLVADALDVEIFTYAPQYESDGTTSWNRSVRGQPQTDPGRQIHLANYMHALHWTALRPVGTFALPALDTVARTPNHSVPDPLPLPRLPIGHNDNFDLRPEARHDDPEDGHTADLRERYLADDETEIESEEEGEEDEEAEEDENQYEYRDDSQDENELGDDNRGDDSPPNNGNGGGVPIVVVSPSSSSTSSRWNGRTGRRLPLSPQSSVRRAQPRAARQVGGLPRTRLPDSKSRSISSSRSLSSPRRRTRPRQISQRAAQRSSPSSPQMTHQNPTLPPFGTPSTSRSSQAPTQATSSSRSDPNFASRLLSAPPMFSPRTSSSRSSQPSTQTKSSSRSSQPSKQAKSSSSSNFNPESQLYTSPPFFLSPQTSSSRPSQPATQTKSSSSSNFNPESRLYTSPPFFLSPQRRPISPTSFTSSRRASFWREMEAEIPTPPPQTSSSESSQPSQTPSSSPPTSSEKSLNSATWTWTDETDRQRRARRRARQKSSNRPSNNTIPTPRVQKITPKKSVKKVEHLEKLYTNWLRTMPSPEMLAGASRSPFLRTPARSTPTRSTRRPPPPS